MAKLKFEPTCACLRVVYAPEHSSDNKVLRERWLCDTCDTEFCRKSFLADALRERDKAQAQCAEMRSAFQEVMGHINNKPIATWKDSLTGRVHKGEDILPFRLYEKAKKALSLDAGRGWVSPEEHRKLGNMLSAALDDRDTALKLQEQAQAEAADWCVKYQASEITGKTLLEEREKLRAVATATTDLVESDPPYTQEQVARVREALDALEKP